MEVRVLVRVWDGRALGDSAVGLGCDWTRSAKEEIVPRRDRNLEGGLSSLGADDEDEKKLVRDADQAE